MSETVAEIDFSNPTPGDVRVYVIRNRAGDSYWLPVLDDAVSELEYVAAMDELTITVSRNQWAASLAALEPGANPFTIGNWTCEVQMVDQNWLESLPEHDGW